MIEDDPGRVGAELGEEEPDGEAQAPHADLQLLHGSPLLLHHLQILNRFLLLVHHLQILHRSLLLVAETECLLALGLE